MFICNLCIFSLSPSSSAQSASVKSAIQEDIRIGGGEVARDELIEAKRLGKKVRFIPADMNHQKARDSARKKKQPEPADFRGAADAAFAK